jgi:[ribosomal protein S5]-alanine N-acetyltransferase
MQADDRYLQKHFSERLSIRPLVKEDIGIWKTYFEDPEYLKYIILPVQEGLSSYEKAEFWFNKQFARYEENRFGLMALIEKDTNQFVGQCGLLKQELEGEPVLEIGYHLLQPYQGKGYATEAAQFFKKLGFDNCYSNELVSIIDIGNLPSEKVAVRNGMTKWKTTIDYFNLRVNVFRIVKPGN